MHEHINNGVQNRIEKKEEWRMKSLYWTILRWWEKVTEDFPLAKFNWLDLRGFVGATLYLLSYMPKTKQAMCMLR